MNEETRREAGRRQDGGAAQENGRRPAAGAGDEEDHGRPSGASPAVSNGNVLRATRAYLLPPSLREHLEGALGEVCELAGDEGMHDLEEHPVVALGRAILEDLEAALAVVDELEQLVKGGSTDAEGLEVFVAARSVEELLNPRLEVLRQMDRDLRNRLGRLADAAGEEP